MGVFGTFRRALAGWSDPLSRDLSRSGDLFIARFRLGLLVLLAFVPLTTSLAGPGLVENWLGLASIALALGFAAWFERLAAKPVPPSWLGLATSQFDVAIISLGFVSFILAGRPIVASNSLVHYTMYFVALAGTGLRHDPRVCLAAGGAALLEYGAIVTWVAIFEPEVWTMSSVYGVFQWDSQVSRLQLIAVATIIHAAVVMRSRAFWLNSMRDQLTGLFNRGFFDESFARLLAGDAPTSFTVAIIDLDDFKSINDRYGHAAGDDALRFAATHLREAFRGQDVVARYGGEEFAVLLQTDRASAVARLDAWRESLDASARIPRLSASVGVASLPEDGSGRGLIDTADRRLYAAKAAGRNRTVADGHEAA
ncbi:MAG: diguanylate cyclase [Acidobacteria bacterium]|nr:diguanylate cyclase [Acidobacteriota bacterium]